MGCASLPFMGRLVHLPEVDNCNACNAVCGGSDAAISTVDIKRAVRVGICIHPLSTAGDSGLF